MSKREETAAAPRENAIGRYLRETRGELRKVTWPTREEAWRLTAIVLGVTAAFAVFMWAWDLLFATSLNQLVQRLLGF